MKAFSALPVLCEESPSVTDRFPYQLASNNFLVVSLNKLLSQQSRCEWFKTQRWRSCAIRKDIQWIEINLPSMFHVHNLKWCVIWHPIKYIERKVMLMQYWYQLLDVLCNRVDLKQNNTRCQFLYTLWAFDKVGIIFFMSNQSAETWIILQM